MVGWEYARMWGGTVFLVEFMFAWPGIGKLVTDAAKVHDFNVVQAGVVVAGIFVVLANLVVDLLSTAVDRRVRGRVMSAACSSSAIRGGFVAMSTLDRLRGRLWWVWLGILAILLLFAVFGPWIAPFDHTDQNVRAKFLSPLSSSDEGFHLLGTDELGRDVFSKVIAGTRLTLFIAFVSTLIGAAVGTVLGMLAGYHGGRIDRLVMRLAEAQTAMPMFLIALLLLSSLGASVWNLIAILPTYVWPTFARLIRAEALRMRTSPFIEAAGRPRLHDARDPVRHLLPNLAAASACLIAISVGQVILAEAGLSFIGAGVQTPDVTWGLLISGGRQYLDGRLVADRVPGPVRRPHRVRAQRARPPLHRRRGGASDDASAARRCATCAARILTRRGEVKAVDGISFDVEQGQSLGVVGESGSGKTMTALDVAAPVRPGDPGPHQRHGAVRRPRPAADERPRAARACAAARSGSCSRIR